MPYCTVEQVRQALARSATSTEDTGASLSEEVIGDNIDQADTEINAKLGGVYATPFDPAPSTPPLIKDISIAIAAYLTDLIFREVRDYANVDGNPVVLRYKRAQELLKALANGNADLPGIEPSPDPSGDGRIVAAIGDGPLFCPGNDTVLTPYRNPNRGPVWDPWGRW